MRIFPSLLAVCIGTTPAAAHEFWIEPDAFEIAADATVIAALVNGQNFNGVRVPYLPQRFVTFTMSLNGETQLVIDRIATAPALQQPPMGDGLHVIGYQSTVGTVDYESWEKFQTFVDHKDLGDLLPLHAARGLPEADFLEAYTRFSKSLISVGDAAGADLRLGLETEFVALSNPYTDPLDGVMQLQLWYGDAVRAEVQVELFEKAPDETVSITYHRPQNCGRRGHRQPAGAAGVYLHGRCRRDPGAVGRSGG